MAKRPQLNLPQSRRMLGPVMSAGAVGRFAAIEVKLKGVIANTKPSSGRCSTRFQARSADIGCSP